jgi:hypothetical protein
LNIDVFDVISLELGGLKYTYNFLKMHLNCIQQDLINFQKTTIVTSIKVHYKMFLPLGYGKQGAYVQQMKI